ncbi:MAG: hypothetical protein F4Z31_16510 [Gemmatimonadetes bacterium]|nr:hypothetical protein [Gemmatimonadota bacterium]MYE94095.1 hypothetical protein [Gemmatimonadota bacterium]MYJ10907.1 hypothetical protein [Gemmatimonadota bacterium]
MSWKPTPKRLVVAGLVSLGGILVTFALEILLLESWAWWCHLLAAGGCWVAAYTMGVRWPERTPFQVRRGDEWVSGSICGDIVARALLGKLCSGLARQEQEAVIAWIHQFEDEHPKAVRQADDGEVTVNARVLRRWIGQIALRREEARREKQIWMGP